MLKHLFKLIWKKKKSSALMMLEIFVSFLILFAIWSLSFYNYRNYAQPSGIVADHVWAVDIEFNAEGDSIRTIYRDLVRQKLKQYPEIESFAFASNNIPYSNSMSSTGIKYLKKEYGSNIMTADPNYAQVLGLQLSEGRWLTEADRVRKNKAVVITRKLKEEIFGKENAIGKIINDYSEKNGMQIVGIIDDFKHRSDFQTFDKCYWVDLFGGESTLILKVREGTTADFEAKLSKDIVQIGKDWSVEVKQMSYMKELKNREIWIPILVMYIICGFLILNVALGLFGVLFQTISSRKQEIGIRRAIGAPQGSILWQFVGETAVIATFGIILGTFFAIQFPLLQVFDVEASIYLIGLLLAILSVYALVVICAFVPSKQASKIYPAVALHEE